MSIFVRNMTGSICPGPEGIEKILSNSVLVTRQGVGWPCTLLQTTDRNDVECPLQGWIPSEYDFYIYRLTRQVAKFWLLR